MKGSYKYQCLGCGEFTYVLRIERTRQARPMCRYCGSHRLESSKGSKAKQRTFASDMARQAQSERFKEQKNPEKYNH